MICTSTFILCTIMPISELSKITGDRHERLKTKLLNTSDLGWAVIIFPWVKYREKNTVISSRIRRKIYLSLPPQTSAAFPSIQANEKPSFIIFGNGQRGKRPYQRKYHPTCRGCYSSRYVALPTLPDKE